MTDTDKTRYLDPDTWWERLYATDADAGVGDRPTPEAEPAEVEDDDQAEPDDQDDEAPVDGPGRWWTRRRTDQADAEAEPEAPATITVPGMPQFRIVPTTGDTKAPGSRSQRGDARWAARLAARRRWALYNGTAAALGWSVDLVHHAGQWIELGAQNPAGTGSVLLAGAGGWLVWKATGRMRVLPHPYLVRPLATAAVATWAAQSAPALVAAMIRHGIPATPTVPIAAGLGLVGALYAIDRRWGHRLWPPAAWVARAPLAAAVLALLLYPTTLT